MTDSTTTIRWVCGPPPASIDPDRRGSDPFLGRRMGDDLPEEGFRVQLGSAAPVLRVHFHVVPQFQYFVAGSGRFGHHDVGPGLVHFSDALTPYGPLQPGSEGVSFLTLRAVSDVGAHYMPEAQDELVEARTAEAAGRPHRNLTIDVASGPAGPEWSALAAEDDGLAVAVAEVPAGATLSLPPIGAGGAFAVVVRGSLAGGEAAESSFTFCRSEHGGATVQAGDDGVRLALFQFAAA